ncbi:uncharacterized protein [Ptychodera flava]|uniref:uncharacterized protein n=1 Tax=Ptychodera flava TaxID=63121 RepID=UPI00396AA707
MVRKQKTWTKKQGLWLPSSMRSAIEAVKASKTSIRKAAKTFNVPRATLHRRLFNDLPDTLASRPCVLSPEDEEELVCHILEMESRGFGLTIVDTCRLAFEIAERKGIAHPFNNDKKRAGYDWFQGFIQRHPQLAIRKPEGLSAARTSMLNPTVVGDYFRKLDEILTKLNLKNRPGQVYNADETGMNTVHRPTNVVGLKGKKNVHSKTSGDRGENVTVLVSCSALGHFPPPMIIFKGQRLSQSLMTNAPPGTLFGVSKSSFIDTELFHQYFEKIFLKYVPPVRPLLLIIDGHSSHLSLKTLKMAKDNGVELFCLPAHTTNWLQPLDRCVFGPLKKEYNKVCGSFMKKNPGQIVTRHDFCGLLRDAYFKTCTVEKAVSAFKATGIFPLNNHAIPIEAFGPSRTTVSPSFQAEQNASLSKNQESISTDSAMPSTSNDKQHDDSLTESVKEQVTTYKKTCKATPDVQHEVTQPDHSDANCQVSDGPQPSTSRHTGADSTIQNSSNQTSQLLTYPVHVRNVNSNKRRRTGTMARCVTADEFIAELEEREERKEMEIRQKELRKKEREEKKQQKQKEKEEKMLKKRLLEMEKLKMKENVSATKSQSTGRAGKGRSRNNRKKGKALVKKTKPVPNPESNLDSLQMYCGHCQGYYYDDTSDDEDWWRCRKCPKWFHETCTGVFGESKLEQFCCDDHSDSSDE